MSRLCAYTLRARVMVKDVYFRNLERNPIKLAFHCSSKSLLSFTLCLHLIKDTLCLPETGKDPKLCQQWHCSLARELQRPD